MCAFPDNLMMRSPSITNSLDAFRQQPNIKAFPAWEFIHGQPKQKPMPTLFHSRLQRNKSKRHQQSNPSL